MSETRQNQKYGIGAAIAFDILSTVMFPATLLGYVIWVGAAVFGGRGSGVSGTAQGPLSARYFEHNLGTREDPAANRLMPLVPGVPRLGLRLVTGTMILAHRITGYVPTAFRYPYEGEIAPAVEASARQTFFDAVVRRYLGDIKQFVILGAGFDTRAYGLLPELHIRSFEVDAPKTQAVKRDMLQKSAIDTTGVTFVSADFEKEDWLARLVEAGFDRAQSALFLWEGVMVYLDREAAEATLRKIATCARGSVLAFDYFTTEPLTSSDLYWRYGRATTKAAGESLKFGIESTPPSRDRLAEFLGSCGLSLGVQQTLGTESGGKRAWGGFATAVVK